MNKSIRLKKITKAIQACPLCKRGSVGLPVPGEGNPEAKILFLGEAPGRLESETGRPFVGRSGQYLRNLIRSIGLDDRKDVYITSPVKYFPKAGHGPSPDKIRHGRVHLLDQIAVIQPRIIVLLGNTAIFSMLEKKLPAISHHGELQETAGADYFFTLHPAAAIRFAKFRTVLEADFRRLKQIIRKKRIGKA